MKLNITIDSKLYEVDVEVAESEPAIGHARLQAVESAAAREPVATVAAPPAELGSAAEAKVCRSPVSGLVASVVAQAGQTLQVGDVLLMLEAMKMETQVTAHVSGIVKTVKVKPGESVQSGQILVEFE